METAERIPADIQEEARRIVERGYDEGLIVAVERALLAERERAARIAEDYAGIWPQERAAVAAAIRA